MRKPNLAFGGPLLVAAIGTFLVLYFAITPTPAPTPVPAPDIPYPAYIIPSPYEVPPFAMPKKQASL